MNFSVNKLLCIYFRLHISRSSVRIQYTGFCERRITEEVCNNGCIVGQINFSNSFSHHISLFGRVFLAFLNGYFSILDVGIDCSPNIVIGRCDSRLPSAYFRSVHLIADACFMFHVNRRVKRKVSANYTKSGADSQVCNQKLSRSIRRVIRVVINLVHRIFRTGSNAECSQE